MKKKILVGISIGDPNGIGLEIIIKALQNKELLNKIIPVVYCPLKLFSFYEDAFNIKLNSTIIDSPTAAEANCVNLLAFNLNKFMPEPGKDTKKAGEIAFESLKLASDDLFNGLTDVIVTGPINKENIQNEDFQFMGHTEYFTSRANLAESLMLMVHNNLRVGLVTNHLPLSKVSNKISAINISNKLTIFASVLKTDFGIKKPRIALLGLNPHAGDNGLIGEEEKSIITPLIKDLKKAAFYVTGPFPADGFFANNNYKNFDGILAMYHDQGLIPFKVLSKNEGVNFTAGLPVIRTSPDHGTGYDIAGKGLANSLSFENAIEMAVEVNNQRKI